MARPRLYATEEERCVAQRVAWQKHNKAHKAERAKYNKQYCLREDIKARRREIYRERRERAQAEEGAQSR